MGISIIGVSNATSLMFQNVLEVSRKFSLGPVDLCRCIRCLKGLVMVL